MPERNRAKGCKGLVEEGQETITEGKEKEEAIADLALVAAAQKVEHYEISGYGTLRTIAEQIGNMKVARLLAQTLSEEEKADKLLTQLSPPLMEKRTKSRKKKIGRRRVIVSAAARECPLPRSRRRVSIRDAGVRASQPITRPLEKLDTACHIV